MDLAKKVSILFSAVILSSAVAPINVGAERKCPKVVSLEKDVKECLDDLLFGTTPERRNAEYQLKKSGHLNFDKQFRHLLSAAEELELYSKAVKRAHARTSNEKKRVYLEKLLEGYKTNITLIREQAQRLPYIFIELRERVPGDNIEDINKERAKVLNLAKKDYDNLKKLGSSMDRGNWLEAFNDVKKEAKSKKKVYDGMISTLDKGMNFGAKEVAISTGNVKEIEFKDPITSEVKYFTTTKDFAEKWSGGTSFYMATRKISNIEQKITGIELKPLERTPIKVVNVAKKVEPKVQKSESRSLEYESRKVKPSGVTSKRRVGYSSEECLPKRLMQGNKVFISQYLGIPEREIKYVRPVNSKRVEMSTINPKENNQKMLNFFLNNFGKEVKVISSMGVDGTFAYYGWNAFNEKECKFTLKLYIDQGDESKNFATAIISDNRK